MPRFSLSRRATLVTLPCVALSLALGLGALPGSAQAAPLVFPVLGGALPVTEPGAVPSDIDAGLLAAKLASVSRASITSAGWAVYSIDGARVTGYDALKVPASTMKVLTSLAAIDVLGADRTFATRVVSAAPGKLVLVGGGDPYLTSARSSAAAKRANLTDLAAATAAALKLAGVKKVTLSYSARLFTGPAYAPSWKSSWSAYTPRISSLTVDLGKSGSRAHTNPARSTASVLAAKLRAKGIKVTLGSSVAEPPAAAVLATVTSAPLGVMVRRLLLNSDNVPAEVLARWVARTTGQPGSFAGGSAALTTWLKSKALWADGMVLDGGSGLSSVTRVRPSVLARALGTALADPKYVDVVRGLPVAGETGTLRTRFNDPSEAAGRDEVHAKTGSLRKVNTLAGYVTTADGDVLTFAFMATQDGKHTTAAGNWLDRSASVLAACGCSLPPVDDSALYRHSVLSR